MKAFNFLCLGSFLLTDLKRLFKSHVSIARGGAPVARLEVLESTFARSNRHLSRLQEQAAYGLAMSEAPKRTTQY